MEWIDKLESDELRRWLRDTVVPMVVISLEGKILWCNSAMEKFSGYSRPELSNARMTWAGLTVGEEEIAAEAEMVDQLRLKQRATYIIQKQIKHKTSMPAWATVHGSRNSVDGDTDCIFISILPVDVAYEYTYTELQEIRRSLVGVVAKLSEPPKNYARQYLEAYTARPFQTIFLTLLVVAFFSGDSIIRTAASVFQAMGGVFHPPGAPGVP